MTVTSEQLLSEAAEILTEYGWTQGQLGDTVTGYCALGALDAAALRNGHYHPREPAYQAAIDRLYQAAGLPTRFDIPAWNDSSARTAEDVILAFKEAGNSGG